MVGFSLGQIIVIIGLTGGIASGKSTAARLLGELGAYVIDADKLGHRAYEPDRPAFAAVVAAFGDDVVAENGQIDRKVLGGKVFGDDDALKRLTDIVWPEIRNLANEEMAAARAENPGCIIVLEAAVMFEAGWHKTVDQVWCVVVAPEVAIERATARDGIDAEAVQARIDAQLSNAEREAQSDIVIDNSGTPEDLERQVKAAWANLKEASS